MKQRVTLEQLREIPSEKIVPLINNGSIKVKSTELIRTDKTAKQLTIGKMIEILDFSSCDWVCGCDCWGEDLEIDGYMVDLDLDNGKELRKSEIELVDALWQAVKEIL